MKVLTTLCGCRAKFVLLEENIQILFFHLNSGKLMGKMSEQSLDFVREVRFTRIEQIISDWNNFRCWLLCILISIVFSQISKAVCLYKEAQYALLNSSVYVDENSLTNRQPPLGTHCQAKN